jgi:5,5'-dehydrodivanillate O-demethylase oxygenase subunit
MLSTQENDRITRIGPGTFMGELFRRYWHPIAAASELDEEPVRQVQILGETLVLYRDRQGGLGLLGPQCPHRQAGMIFAIPEQNGLRCAYHGWLFDSAGRCLEQPAEDMDAPNSTFRDRTTIAAYPVQELGGLVFAYLGPNPAPLLPRWEPLVAPNVLRSIGWCIIPCNWLQIMENSLDPTHVEWLHRRFDNYVLERLGRTDLKHDVRHHAKIGFDAFDYGIVKRRVWQGGTEDDPEWKYGHPILFPNILQGSAHSLQIRVPVDDERTLHIWYNSRPPKDVESTEQESVPFYQVPMPGVDERGRPTWGLLDSNSGQDMVMWYSQGGISDRSEEKLGTADKGIILYRRMLEQNARIVEDGGEPINYFTDAARNQSIHIPTEDDGGGIAERRLRSVGDRRPTGQSGKYDPLLAGKADKDLAGAGMPSR